MNDKKHAKNKVNGNEIATGKVEMEKVLFSLNAYILRHSYNTFH